MASAQVMQIAYSELSDVERIAEGGFGFINRATHPHWGTVVYKELKTSVIPEGSRAERELKNEAKAHVLKHENIVTLFAMVLEKGHYGIVLEFVPGGCLEQYVYQKKPEWPEKLYIAHGVVRGMEYLHSIQPHPVIHGDLKIQNVLVADGSVAKICDFGLAKWKEYSKKHTSSKSHRGGTVTHTPPEIWIDVNQPRTVKYDVYGFGVVFWELLAEQLAFNHVKDDDVIRQVVKGGQRPDLNAVTGPVSLVAFAKNCISRCWHQEPGERPSFTELNSEFEAIRRMIQTNSPAAVQDLPQHQPVACRRYTEGAVWGVTQAENRLYLVYWNSNTIHVFNVNTFSPLGAITVEGLGDPSDIVSCRDDRLLYLADRDSCVWRVSVMDHSQYENWLPISSTNDEFRVYTLSLTSRKLLVTSQDPPRLHQYSADGQLMCDVKLPCCIKSLLHGVETTRCTFVIGHQGTQQVTLQSAVSEVNNAGNLLNTFTMVAGPQHLLMVGDGNLLATDYDNHRILLLNRDLQLQRVVFDRESQIGLWWPLRLYYDHPSSRLCVVQSREERNMRSDLVSILNLR